MKIRSMQMLSLLWRFIKWILSILILGIAIGVLGNLTYNYVTTGKINFADPRTLTVVSFILSYPYQIIFLLIPIIALTFVTYLGDYSYQKLLQQRVEQKTNEIPPQTQNSQNRQRMLKKVWMFWINGVLEQSLHGEALLALGMKEYRDAVENPWRLVFKHSNEPERLLPADISISKVYDDAGGDLLILGEPGSGKTTLLLELTQNLLKRVTQEDIDPMPVVFNLSSWALNRESLADWLVEELNIKYQVPRKIGQMWVNTDQILPLLDGLDEVSSTHRSACIEVINDFRREHGMLPMVVCSRLTDYFAQSTLILLHNAVIVQPLSEQQIDEYLHNAGQKLEALRIALDNDPSLKELAANPLMLSVMTLAYQKKSVEELLVARTSEAQRQQIFTAYIDSMLHRRSNESRYKQKQIIQWLQWLADQLAYRSQTEFYIERIQPDWLRAKKSNQLYYKKIAPLLIGGLIGGAIGALVGFLFQAINFGTNFGLNYGIGYSFIGLLIGILFNKGKTEIRSTEGNLWSLKSMWERFFKAEYFKSVPVTGLTIGFIFGIIAWLIYGPAVGLTYFLIGGLFGGLAARIINPPLSGLLCGLIYGICVGPITALLSAKMGCIIGALVIGLISEGKSEIRPTEVVVWSWKSVFQSLFNLNHIRNSLPSTCCFTDFSLASWLYPLQLHSFS